MEEEPTELMPDEVIDQKLNDAETAGYAVAFGSSCSRAPSDLN